MPETDLLKGKRIILGITGSIAAYKAAEITRELIKREAQVYVVMTKAATHFISPLTLQTLSGNPVITELFYERGPQETHIDLASRNDLLLIAPATANIIGKISTGIADDILTTLVLATTSPILMAPAMNEKMYYNSIFKENMEKLARYGVEFIEPEYGKLAYGQKGMGRLASISKIIEAVKTALKRRKDLSGKRILVTAGPTQEPIDEVRYIANRSSAKMGFALARAAYEMGGKVILISGPTLLKPPLGVEFIQIRTALEMYEAVKERFKEVDIGIFAAAVADFHPSKAHRGKIKKEEKGLVVELTPNPDILKEIGKDKGSKILVGFAAEVEDLIANASLKLKEKNLDMIVANRISEEGAGFEVDTNIVTIISKEEAIEKLPQLSKDEVARLILKKVVDMVEAAGFEPVTSSVRRMRSPN